MAEFLFCPLVQPFPAREGWVKRLGSATQSYFACKGKGLGLPSMAIPFGGRNAHWTFLLLRLTPAADGLVSAHPLHASPLSLPSVIEKLPSHQVKLALALQQQG